MSCRIYTPFNRIQVFVRMNTKWGKRVVVITVCYFALHLVVNLIDNRRVIDRTEIPKKKESDGPLVMKDIGEKHGKVLTSIYLMDSKSLISNTEDLEMHPSENITHPLPPIAPSFVEKLKKAAKLVHSKSDDFLLLTLINGAYLNLTLNWLCNVAVFKSNIHSKTLIVSTDEQNCKKIRKEWPNVSCLLLDLPVEYNAPLNWGRQSYINLLTIRSELMLLLVMLDIPYILFETDATWLRDPMQYFENQTLIDDADIVVPIKGYNHHGQKYTFDPMIVYPTNGSRSLLSEMRKRLMANPKLLDQDVLEELCRRQHNGVVCRLFEWNDIADGKWFKLAEAQRATIQPYIVNNNYYVGVQNKISRQALNGLWFLTAKGKCLKSKTENMLKKLAHKNSSSKMSTRKGEKKRKNSLSKQKRIRVEKLGKIII